MTDLEQSATAELDAKELAEELAFRATPRAGGMLSTAAPDRLDALEFTRRGEQVVLHARGASIGERELSRARGESSRCARGGIAPIDDYQRRGEALFAAGVSVDAGGR